MKVKSHFPSLNDDVAHIQFVEIENDEENGMKFYC